MIKAELILRIAEQNPHLFNKDVKGSSMPFLTRSEQPWPEAIELNCGASEYSR